MGSRVRDNGCWLAAALLGLALVAYITLATRSSWLDYEREARPAVSALVHGQLGRFLALAPAYGGSLLLRAPPMLAAHALGGGGALVYRASALPSLLAGGALGLWLADRMRPRGSGVIARSVALGLCILNPITIQAVWWGHPEELLGAVLCVAAVLLAAADRPAWAGIMLGMAIANKEWGLLAVGPVLVALPERRLRALAWAAAVAGLLAGPFLVGGEGVGQRVQATIATGATFQRWQIWWFFGAGGHLPGGVDPSMVIGYRTAPGWVESLAHPLIVALAVPLTLLYALRRRGTADSRRGRRHGGEDALLLLALLLLLRCVLDPWDIVYYALPFLLALLTWESLRFQRPPVLAVAAFALAWFLYMESYRPVFGLSTDAQVLLFIACSLTGALAIALALLAPRRGGRELAGLGRRRPVSAIGL